MEGQSTIPSVMVSPASTDAVNCQAAEEVTSSNRLGQQSLLETRTLSLNQDLEDWVVVSHEMEKLEKENLHGQNSLENEQVPIRQYVQTYWQPIIPSACEMSILEEDRKSLLRHAEKTRWLQLEQQASMFFRRCGSHNTMSTLSGILWGPKITPCPPAWMNSTLLQGMEMPIPVSLKAVPSPSLEESLCSAQMYIRLSKELLLAQMWNVEALSAQEDLSNDISPKNTEGEKLHGAASMIASSPFEGSRGFKVLKDILSDGTESNSIVSCANVMLMTSTSNAGGVVQALVRYTDLFLRSPHVIA